MVLATAFGALWKKNFNCIAASILCRLAGDGCRRARSSAGERGSAAEPVSPADAFHEAGCDLSRAGGSGTGSETPDIRSPSPAVPVVDRAHKGQIHATILRPCHRVVYGNYRGKLHIVRDGECGCMARMTSEWCELACSCVWASCTQPCSYTSVYNCAISSSLPCDFSTICDSPCAGHPLPKKLCLGELCSSLLITCLGGI